MNKLLGAIKHVPEWVKYAIVAYVAIGFIVSAIGARYTDIEMSPYSPTLSWPVTVFVVVFGIFILETVRRTAEVKGR